MEDPYEQETVCVGPSAIPFAGEGLFAKRRILKDQAMIIGYYFACSLFQIQQSLSFRLNQFYDRLQLVVLVAGKVHKGSCSELRCTRSYSGKSDFILD